MTNKLVNYGKLQGLVSKYVAWPKWLNQTMDCNYEARIKNQLGPRIPDTYNGFLSTIKY